MATILIVDERTLDPASTAVLGHSGHRLFETPDGDYALELVRTEEPDLVLTDILLPAPGGYDLVRHLRLDASVAQPKVVFLAADYLEAEARSLAQVCGVSGIVTTPTAPHVLLEAVSAALSEPLPKAPKLNRGTSPSDEYLREIANKLYRRLGELERLNGLLGHQTAERAEQLERARSALGQEVNKRLWAERALTQANRRLQDKAMRDALTGLYNRGYLEESLARETSRARRYNQTFGVMMIDIDHFKLVNDTFGHAAGDAVLRAVGQHLLSLARAEDIPCRYGGEEFALVMTHAAPATVHERAERLREAVQEMRIESNGSGVGPITLSVGIAMFPRSGDNGQAVLQAADVALYRAKAAGRNRVVVAENGKQ